jgi:hypothetical protein
MALAALSSVAWLLRHLEAAPIRSAFCSHYDAVPRTFPGGCGWREVEPHAGMKADRAGGSVLRSALEDWLSMWAGAAALQLLLRGANEERKRTRRFRSDREAGMPSHSHEQIPRHQQH